MLFNSYSFLIFFPLVCLIYYLIPKRYQYLWLLAASYYFYMSWNAKYALLLLFSTFVTWLCGLVLGRLSRREAEGKDSCALRKLAVAGNFVLTLSLLFLFKYFDFAVDSLNRLLSATDMTLLSPEFDPVLPVGISFFTFQALSYSMDVYRGEISVEKSFLRYALFVSFFPQLVAGPIERSKNLLCQVREEHSFSFERMRDGLLLMLWGYFLKLVIADRAAVFVDAVYNDVYAFGGWYTVLASLLFSVQIYCDFAGYSVIALGAAKVMGFKLMENFRYPYLSVSISQFWRNWHISLSSWFRDYLYIPLGGNRKGRLRKFFNLMVVFLVSGLWHGASWHYVVWGGIHGVYQILEELLKPAREWLLRLTRMKRDGITRRLLSVLFTFVLVDMAWVFFRANSVSEAVYVLRSMFFRDCPAALSGVTLLELGLNLKGFVLLIFAGLLLLAVDLMKQRHIDVVAVVVRQRLCLRWTIYLVAIMFVLIFGVWGPAFDASSFIYFQF